MTHFCRKNWHVRETMSGQKGGITLTRSDVLNFLFLLPKFFRYLISKT